MATYNIILIGSPGSGKGTVAERLMADFHIAHLSTGDILRECVVKGSDLGKEIKKTMESGQLVSDDIVIAAVEEAIKAPECKKGFILDGFPRNLSQANKLDELLSKLNLHIDFVIKLDIDDALLISRISGRRVHLTSGRSYHIQFHPPKVPNKDDVTGEDLIQRPDDNPKTLSERLATYHKQTEPVLQFYQSKGKVFSVDASKKSDEVYAQVKQHLVKN